ncbi:MAG: 23S rRNA pseudouridine2605 synthase [Flavobacteriaceae bacterium]|jgi:23S rRNA pseudouridine2605 synthase|uniref:pseudouridine synthase n=1 Tax=Candidatus Marifrigoribacter sp. Uisw_064 TaxID=3230970 RepID=UPI003ADACAC9
MQQGKNRKDSGKGKGRNPQGKDAGKGRWKKDDTKAKEKNTTKKPKVAPKSATDGIRLNKYISNSGVCSRREADMYIQVGSVTVNGKIINEMGFKVKLTDEVTFDGRRINPEPKAYVLLNKPKGFATTISESKGNTVMDLVSNASAGRINPIGRLGRNATGLLLFTNDDEFMQKFTRKGVSRLFHVVLDKNLKQADLIKIKEGIKLEGKTISIDDISYVENSPKKEIGLKIKHTGNSVIRNIFESLNYNVVVVDCVTIGPLTKKDLPRGRWRNLTEQELNTINML